MTTPLDHLAHRPWPLPATRWRWRQRWEHVVLLHFPVPAIELRSLVPAALNLDEFEGTAWVSVVPFRMARVRPRYLPAFAPVSDFAELNFRTYVRAGAFAGVLFLSIHAEKRLSSWLARRFSGLPYVHAPMSFRDGETDRGATFEFRSDLLRVRGEAFAPLAPTRLDDLDVFLTERYCLYTSNGGRVARADVHHAPWPLHRVEAELERNELLHGLSVADPLSPTRIHYSPGVDVVAWSERELSELAARG